jgi:hypothetical protein
MPKEPAKQKDGRGGPRSGAGRPSLGKVMVKAYLPASLAWRLDELAQKHAITKSRLIEELLALSLPFTKGNALKRRLHQAKS